jgi:hypothetical protein
VFLPGVERAATNQTKQKKNERFCDAPSLRLSLSLSEVVCYLKRKTVAKSDGTWGSVTETTSRTTLPLCRLQTNFL